MYRIGSLLLAFLLVASPQAMAEDKPNLQPILSLLIGGSSLVVTDPDSYQLSVIKNGDGTGIVSPGSGLYPAGTDVTLYAVPNENSTFTGWISSPTTPNCSGTGTCTVSMDSDVTVYATFDSTIPPGHFNLSLITTGSGSITKTPDASSYAAGTSVLLTPSADPGFVFKYWSGGGCTGSGTCTVLMDQNHVIQGVFEAETVAENVRLTIVDKEGSGVVTSTDGGISCGPDCTEGYPINTHVTLEATPEGFLRWEGANGNECPQSPSCTLVMDANKEVKPVFSVLPAYDEGTDDGTNNVPGGATPAALDGILKGSLSTTADEDWFSVTVTSAKTVTLRFESANSLSTERWRVLVYRAFNNSLMAGVTVDADDTFNVFLPWAEKYYFVVVAEESETFADGAYYSLTLLDVDPASVDPVETEPNNTWLGGQADLIPLNSTIHGNLMTLDDQDWYRIDPVAADTTATLTFTGSSNPSSDPNGDWIIRIYKGTTEQKHDIVVKDGSSFNFRVDAGATYYIRVTEHMEIVGKEDQWNGAEYALTVNEYIGSAIAELEINNTSGTANDLGTYSSSLDFTGQLMTETDADWFKFNVNSPQDVKITFSSQISGTHWRIFVYKDGIFNTHINNDANDWAPTYGPTYPNEDISVSLTTAGTYYIKVVYDTTTPPTNLISYSSGQYGISIHP